MREQSRVVQDLNKQMVQLQEEKQQIAQRREVQRDQDQATEDDRERLRTEREHLPGQIQQQDHAIARLRHELCNREEHIQSLTVKQESVMHINRALTAENKKLQERVNACLGTILQLQPRNQIPDNYLIKQYDELHAHIIYWTGIALDGVEMEQRLESLPANVDEWPELLRTHFRDGHVRLAKEYIPTQPWMLHYLVDCFLRASILGEDTVLFGLNSVAVQFMRDTEQGMKKVFTVEKGTCRRASLQRPDGLFSINPIQASKKI
jgi:regulator of replication initiation timing